ncbi:unnamed protein product [Meloidogyne enterolobii]|uniref:Uncharacterized protein n=1 Tax=Meloidogyne enterolobii TaxID=390850 RepID=A0ACB0YZ28_MELEN
MLIGTSSVHSFNRVFHFSTKSTGSWSSHLSLFSHNDCIKIFKGRINGVIKPKGSKCDAIKARISLLVSIGVAGNGFIFISNESESVFQLRPRIFCEGPFNLFVSGIGSIASLELLANSCSSIFAFSKSSFTAITLF